jgi:hypothetical protein
MGLFVPSLGPDPEPPFRAIRIAAMLHFPRKDSITMRTSLLLIVGVCMLAPALSYAQATAQPQNPPAQGAPAKPSAPNAEKKEVKVPAKVLQTYVGSYEMAPGRVLNMTLENGYLYGQPEGQDNRRQLWPESQTKFFLKEAPITITFKSEKGKVTGLLYQQEGRPDREAKKIK